MKIKTIKNNFYNLVLKIFLYTFLSTLITYIALCLAISSINSENNKPTDYYVKYINEIAKEVEKNGDTILKGNLIDVKKYSKEIQYEVVDLSGNHLYGEKGVKNDKFNIMNSINQDRYDSNYIYRYIGITENNNIKAIFIVKAPFDYIINNFKTNKTVTFVYILGIFSPIIYFILYLFIFTSKLYKSISKNVDILLYGAEKICDGDLDFYITGVQGKEFNKIQESFNTMVQVLRGNIEDLSKLDNERRMMVSSIAHDIRTPITVIKGQIEIINDLKDVPNYNIDDNMSIINKNCDRMTNLTNNLSLLYKVEGEFFLLKNEKANLKKLLKDKELELKSLGEKKDLNIQFKINLNKDKYVLDSNMLCRVLDNILYNSLRFTHKGEILLEVQDDEFSSRKINFKCSDTGSGFKQEDTSKLFEAFYQDEDYKNHLGLGLYIAKKIVTNYNGKIKAYNNSSHGATIEFYIEELNEYPIS